MINKVHQCLWSNSYSLMILTSKPGVGAHIKNSFTLMYSRTCHKHDSSWKAVTRRSKVHNSINRGKPSMPRGITTGAAKRCNVTYNSKLIYRKRKRRKTISNWHTHYIQCAIIFPISTYTHKHPILLTILLIRCSNHPTTI